MDKNSYFRPLWTCGRYDSDTHSAIVFNLVAGLSFFFEDSSADVIGLILKHRRCEMFDMQDITDESGKDFKLIADFFRRLSDYGLISNRRDLSDMVNDYRWQMLNAQDHNGNVNKQIENSELTSSDAEKAYVKRFNKRASVVMPELSYACSESFLIR